MNQFSVALGLLMSPGLSHHTISKPFVMIEALQTANFTRQFRQIEEFVETRFRYYNRLQIKVIIAKKKLFFSSSHPKTDCVKNCCIKFKFMLLCVNDGGISEKTTIVMHLV